MARGLGFRPPGLRCRVRGFWLRTDLGPPIPETRSDHSNVYGVDSNRCVQGRGPSEGSKCSWPARRTEEHPDLSY